MSNNNNIHVLSRAVIIDQGHILLCQTVDLPIAFYFLPGGHIEHSESAEAALLREITEESGAKCYIKRFLGCLEHSFEPGHNSICHNHEYNFIFEVESSMLKLGIKIPQMESHIKLVWIPLNTMNIIDFRPEYLREILVEWIDSPSNNSFKSQMI
jgi:8-oxo-dGTP diphosphatase